MTCDLCGEQEATVHLTEIIQEQTRELHLCEPCAKAKGVKMDSPFGLADLLTGLADVGPLPTGPGGQPPPACPQCGMRFEDFKRSGRLGCGACYETFRRPLAALLTQIHGAARHVGRMPSGTTAAAAWQAQLDGLKARLKQAVTTESFEEAGRLRDEIQRIEQRLATKRPGRPPPRRTE